MVFVVADVRVGAGVTSRGATFSAGSRYARSCVNYVDSAMSAAGPLEPLSTPIFQT
jgi:hypothetical protein